MNTKTSNYPNPRPKRRNSEGAFGGNTCWCVSPYPFRMAGLIRVVRLRGLSSSYRPDAPAGTQARGSGRRNLAGGHFRLQCAAQG